jgi:hypothetical protein
MQRSAAARVDLGVIPFLGKQEGYTSVTEEFESLQVV